MNLPDKLLKLSRLNPKNYIWDVRYHTWVFVGIDNIKLKKLIEDSKPLKLR